VYVDGQRRQCKIDGKIKVSDLIVRLGFTRETVIAKVNGKVVTEYDYAEPSDRVDLIRVSTGG